MQEEKQTLTTQQAIDVAIEHHQAGRLSQAENIYQHILAGKPNQPIALHLLGVIAHQTGKNDLALDMISKALTVDPDYAEAHNNLGKVLEDIGNLSNALDRYEIAAAIEPNLAGVHFNQGNVLQKLGRLSDAALAYRKALHLNHNSAETHYGLGNVLKKLGRTDQAVESYNSAVKIQPNYPEAHNNLGTALQEVGRHIEAMASYKKAIHHKPDYATAYNNLGTALHNDRKFDAAARRYQRAIVLKPDYADARNNLSTVLQLQGKIEEAVQQIDLALFHNPSNSGWHIKKALLLPPVYDSEESIDAVRNNVAQSIAALRKQRLSIADPVSEVATTGFHLAYHGKNNRHLMKEIAKLHISTCPQLTYESKHFRSRKSKKKKALRVGFVSSFFRDHTIGKFTRGTIKLLTREQFEVFVFRLPRRSDAISRFIDDAADNVVLLTGKLKEDQARIENAEMDILFYPDIGMSPLTYFLAFSRLAPVQVTTWGHPDTTGIPNIDYFLSSKDLEVDGLSEHYSERVIKLDSTTPYYFRPKPQKEKFTLNDYDLPTENRLYLCPQTLVKFHPSFDNLLGEILQRDPCGRIVLIDDDKGGYLKQGLQERFSLSFPETQQNVIFLSRMSHSKFLHLLTLVSALLDIPTFSGGTSSLEAFAMGAPIVTWPQKFLRSRFTAALYKQMGFNDLIARDSDSYVDLSLRLAQNENFKSQICDKIRINSYKLFERHESIKELETVFIDTYKTSQEGHTLPYEI